MHRIWVEPAELALRIAKRLRGVGRFPDPHRYFDEGGVAAAERACAEINRDLLGWMRPVSAAELPEVSRFVPADGGEHLSFASPLPAGDPVNDVVHLRVWRPPDRSASAGKVVVFHHPIYQAQWRHWRKFVDRVARTTSVAAVAAPFHFDRTPPGWFPGEGTINPNPLWLFRAIRQWIAEQPVVLRVLREHMRLEPVAVVGFSLGAFQSLLATAAGVLDLPIVSVASTNRYAFGLQHGVVGASVIRAMRRVGIDGPRLERMVDSMQLERYVVGLQDHPVLYIDGIYDRVDPPPSLQRLERALGPTRSVHLPGGHGTLWLFRERIGSEALRFLEEIDAL